ncbi:putative WRKY transcription factor 52 [Dorcoceras hygrometricum]|uniref:Putative WRKY transcription factor 52 n=1 Tax=Dorcoceras hygrometricum TaxID=472368 RepID=A0A2Z7CQ79_9LAMI|nr:putative WRKY transcription factor 52 [Dorcoceras hygrometricum]
MVTPGSRQARGYAVQILIARTVGRYISINDKISVKDVEDVGDASRVKKTPVKRAVSKKRPATAVVELEAVPLQVIKPITAAPPKPKRKAPKRKLILPAGSADEIAEEETDVEKQREEPTADVVVNEPTVETFVEKEKETSGDDVDSIIKQILEDTAHLETDMGDTGETVVGGPTIQTSDDFISGDFQLVTTEADRMIGVENDPDEERRTDDESMTLEEIFVNNSSWRKDDMEKLKDILLMHIRDLEKQFSDRFDQQDRAYMVILNSIRQEIHDQKTLPSLDFLMSQKRIITHVAVVAIGLNDVQKDVQDTKDTFFHQLLDFRAQA